MEKPGIELATPGLQGIGLSPTPFVAFLGSNQFRQVVLDMCVSFMSGTSKGSLKVVLWRSREANLRPLVYKTKVYPLHHSGFEYVFVAVFLGCTSTGQVGLCFLKKTFCGFSMGSNQYWAGRVYYLCVYYMTGTPKGSTENGFMEKPRIEPATPGLQDIGLSPTPRRIRICFCRCVPLLYQYWPGGFMLFVVLKTFCGFPWVETSTAGRVYDLCVYYMTGAPKGSPKVVLCGFMEKPGIEPATPGLQGIALIHYTTGGFSCGSKDRFTCVLVLF